VSLWPVVWEGEWLFFHFEGAMFGFYWDKLGCWGSIIVSLIGTAILIVAMRSCSG
jgi:uncharacterized membrane protein YeaQ/YmgE (transglycosylase-associated protein family)